MGEFGSDVLAAIKHGYSWFGNVDMLKFAGIAAVLYFIYELLTPKTFEYSNLLTFFALLFVFTLAIFVISLVISLSALKSVTEVKRTFSIGLLIDYLVLQIKVFIWAAFSLDRPKYLLLLLASLVFIVAGVLTLQGGVVGFALLAVGIILSLAYVVVMLYNSGRLMFANLHYLTKEMSRNDAMDAAREMTNGRVLGVYGRTILSGIVFSILLLAVSWVFTSIASQIKDQAISNVLTALLVSPANAVMMVCTLFVSVYVYSIYLGIYKGQPALSKPVPAAVKAAPKAPVKKAAGKK